MGEDLSAPPRQDNFAQSREIQADILFTHGKLEFLHSQMLWSTQLGHLIVSWDASLGVIQTGRPFQMLCWLRDSAHFLMGSDSRIGTLTITSGRSVCSQLDRFWGCQAVGGLLNTLAEWMPYKILLWRVQVRINLSCLLPYSIDQPLHMLVFWFWKFVSLIYTGKCTVTGQNMAFIIL